MENKALIYCRVSSQRQVTEGNGNVSQEQRCRNYAKEKGYEVEAVFLDDGISGALFNRPAMKELIDYIDARPTEKFIVIFDDLARFARDVEVHIKLKTELIGRGVKLECLNFSFDDSPESEFAELIIASSNQLFRKQNRRQVIQKMKARLEAGYWCFFTPPGMKNFIHPERGRILGDIEPQATIIKTAIEQFRDKILLTVDDVARFINQQYVVQGINDEVSRNSAWRILRQILYTGWIEYKPWDVTLRKGKHDGIISMETYLKVCERLKGKERTNLRKDYSLDFPLRNIVLCSNCRQPLTASWTKGRSKKFPYYWCKNYKCPMQYKSIPKAEIEAKFTELLIKKKLDEKQGDLIHAVLNDVWNQTKESYRLALAGKRRQLEKLDTMISKAKEALFSTARAELKPIYEDELLNLMNKKKELGKEPKQKKFTSEEFGTASRRIFDVLENPVNMWQSDQFQDKRTIYYMFFEEKLPYDRVNGFGTARLAPAVELIHSFDGNKDRLVEMEGLNPRVKVTP